MIFVTPPVATSENVGLLTLSPVILGQHKRKGPAVSDEASEKELVIDLGPQHPK